jgi:hypothetical protein
MASTIQVDKIQDMGGNTILQSDGSGTATTTLPVGFGGTGAATLAAAGLANTPAFLTQISGVQSIANTTDVTVQFNSTTDGFDTDSGFNTGTYTYTIPSGEGGKYYMYAGFLLACNVADKFWSVKFVTTSGQRGEIYGNSNSASSITPRAHMIQNFSAGDTVYVRIYHDFGGAKNTGTGMQGNYFGGFKLIGV